MKPKKIAAYDSPAQFEPLLPGEAKLGPLLEQAGELIRQASALCAASGPTAQSELRTLLRSMNSYYTNRIEGEHTRPVDIERALQQDFSQNQELARKQRLAVAHIRAEQDCEALLDAAGAQGSADLYGAEVLSWLHGELFRDLLPGDRLLSDGTTLVAGELRSKGVAVGRHEAPAHQAVPAFLARWQQVYGGARRGEAATVAIAAAHHRLTWVHPFLDGNGRVARLHTHLLLHAGGLTGGLWSPLRGFARSADRYKALLQAADEHRRGDLDGRGNLTEAGLVDWIRYTLDVCLDQVQFMAKQLHVTSMKDRIEAAIAYEASAVRSGVRAECLRPLHYLFATQEPLPRADFKAMTGLTDRLATEAVSSLLRRGFLATDSPYGKLRFAIPRHALRFYFPALWPEAEQDQALVQKEAGAA